METRQLKAERYRNRAEQMRTISDSMKMAAVKKAFAQLAKDYDDLVNGRIRNIVSEPATSDA